MALPAFRSKGVPKMFGRRRRVAPVIQAPAPEATDEQVLELLTSALGELVGAHGAWTLVPRRDDDTDVFFHDLKSQEIAATLTGLLSRQKADLRGERTAEPHALPWTPSPITAWADVEPTGKAPVELRTAADARLVA
jgi:hypothetical protein